MTKDETKIAIWTQEFNELMKVKGAHFPSDAARKTALAKFIAKHENAESHNPALATSSKDAPAAAIPAAEAASTKKEAAKNDNSPYYSKTAMNNSEAMTQVFIEEIKRVQNDPRYSAVPYGANNHNCVIDITAAFRNGVEMYTPVVNRKHGKDMNSTGNSIKKYGAQQPLLVITKRMADAVGMQVERFSNDKSNKPLASDGFVFLDGNGRMNNSYEYGDAERPQFYATFPEPDPAGTYNPRNVMEVINVNYSPWKTPDMMVKRQLEDGVNAHEGWSLVQALLKKDYMYQAACQTYTLDIDRITKKQIITGDAHQIFKYLESAKPIHTALVSKFGEGEDKTLKTKEFSREVSILWRKLRDLHGEQWATEEFIKFINGFEATKVSEIMMAKSKKNGLKKDEIRKNILNEQFNLFLAKEGIELD